MSSTKTKTIINFDELIDYSEWVNQLPQTYEDEPIEYPESKLISRQFDYLESIKNSTEELPF